MTDTKKINIDDVIKALECCAKNNCTYDCPFYHDSCIKCKYSSSEIIKFAFDTISHLKKENDDLFYKLQGVMWSVDKWLDGKELEQDEVNRAIAMREKTLQITEQQEAEIKNLKKFCNDFSETLSKNHSKAEVEKWQAVDSAINGFADEAIKRICTKVVAPTPEQSYIVERCNQEIHELAKEKAGAE